jgi:CHAT domain-containing protein
VRTNNAALLALLDVTQLSELARAFFYAQARALLVSHWAIDSNATVKLVTAAMAERARNTGIGHARQ